jgi:hypothetical protein
MTNIRATVRGRRLELDVPADWPDGTEVEIQPLSQRGAADHSETMSAEEVAKTLAAMEHIEVLDLTDDERAAWEVERKVRRER